MSTATRKPTASDRAITEGIRDAWDYWFREAGFHLPGTIPEAIGGAFRDWLAENSDRIIAAIAERAARTNGQTPDASVETT
jgi:hypothetical protein